MIRVFLFFLVLMLVGCESDPVLTALKPSETVIEVKETALPEKSSIDMDYLFQHKPSALQIQIRKEQSLNASGSLLEKVWELLKQSNKLAAGVVYNDQQYDLDEADITLSFSSYKPIILNTKYFYFRFAGETTFYALPMGTSYKWGHLTKESTLNGLEYTGFAEKLLNEQEVDLDGDGKAEKMSLVYNGDLELRINGLSEIVYANLADIDSVYRTMNQKPEISIESPSEGTHKKMIVSLVWATNKIGSTVEMWVYEYRNEQIKRIWQLADEQPKTITTYNGNRNITVEIAEYRLKQQFMISDENYKQYQENLIELGTNTEYFIKDLDGDGYNELITKRITYVDGPPFYFETLFTIFKLNDEKLKPAKAFLVNGINQTFIEQLLHGEPINIERNNKELIDEGLIIKESGNQYRISVQ